MMMQIGKTDLGCEVTGNIVIHPLNLNFYFIQQLFFKKQFSRYYRSLYIFQVLFHQNPRVLIFYTLTFYALQEDIFSSAMGGPLKVFLFMLVIFCSLRKKLPFYTPENVKPKCIILFCCFLLIFVDQHFLVWRLKRHQITSFQKEQN